MTRSDFWTGVVFVMALFGLWGNAIAQTSYCYGNGCVVYGSVDRRGESRERYHLDSLNYDFNRHHDVPIAGGGGSSNSDMLVCLELRTAGKPPGCTRDLAYAPISAPVFSNPW